MCNQNLVDLHRQRCAAGMPSDTLEFDALEIAACFPLSALGQPAPGPHGAVGA